MFTHTSIIFIVRLVIYILNLFKKNYLLFKSVYERVICHVYILHHYQSMFLGIFVVNKLFIILIYLMNKYETSIHPGMKETDRTYGGYISLQMYSTVGNINIFSSP